MRPLAAPAGIAIILAGCAGREAAPPSAEREAVLRKSEVGSGKWEGRELEVLTGRSLQG